ncbi:MAG: hypothetical protein ACXVYB_04330 [Arthrobacter sp.]
MSINAQSLRTHTTVGDAKGHSGAVGARIGNWPDPMGRIGNWPDPMGRAAAEACG